MQVVEQERSLSMFRGICVPSCRACTKFVQYLQWMCRVRKPSDSCLLSPPPLLVHICLTALHTINNQRESFIAVWSEWMWAVWVECFFQWAVDWKHVVVQGVIPPRLLLFTIATCNMRSVLSPHSYFQDEELFHILLTGRKERVRGMCVEVKCSVEISKLCYLVWFYWPYREPCNAGGEKNWSSVRWEQPLLRFCTYHYVCS